MMTTEQRRAIAHAETVCAWAGADDHIAQLRDVRAELEALLDEAEEA